MEKLLQSIVKKFIKRIDPTKIEIKKVDRFEAKEWDDSVKGGVVTVYKIKYNHLTIGTVVTLVDGNKKYVSNIDIIAPFRSMGIGGNVLKRYFSGHYIMADNSRAARLYARLGKAYNKFTHKEFEDFIDLCGMQGVYKLDRKPRY